MPATLDREQWLLNAAELICDDIITPVTSAVCPPYRVSVGFPKGRRTSAVSSSFAAEHSDDGHVEIFISPTVDDPRIVLAALTHELVHTFDRHIDGHRGRFARIAHAIGFFRPFTEPVPGPRLSRELADVAELVGDLPHAKLDPTADSRPGRMVKIHCPSAAGGCGFIAYTSAKWVRRLNPEGAACPVCDNPTVCAP